MNLRIGDKVRFLNDVGGGRVSGFKNKQIALIEDEDGFEIPMLITECVVVEKADSPAMTTGSTPVAEVAVKTVESPIEFQDKKDFEAYFAISPEYKDAPLQGKMELYLINDSNYYCYYLVEENNAEGKAIADGLLHPNTHQPLGTYTAPELGEIGKVKVRLLPFMRGKNFKQLPTIEKVSTFNAVKLSKSASYADTPLLSFPAHLIPLHQDTMELAIKQLKDQKKPETKHQGIKSKLKSPKKDSDIVEVDLHIEALVDDISDLSKKEMLDHQVKVFEDTIAEYKDQKGKRIVFIHGVGNGRLKTDIRKTLERKYKMDYQDASFREYGYGATMVIVR